MFPVLRPGPGMATPQTCIYYSYYLLENPSTKETKRRSKKGKKEEEIRTKGKDKHNKYILTIGPVPKTKDGSTSSTGNYKHGFAFPQL